MQDLIPLIKNLTIMKFSVPKTNNLIDVDYQKIKKAYLIFKALNKKWTQKILKVIAQEKQITVKEINTRLDLHQPITSRNLAHLRKADIVTVVPAGTLKYYSVNYKTLDDIEAFLKDL